MPLASGPTAISKMYVDSTLVSAAYANSASLLFNPSSLFSASEQGAWYDPRDWSTLFQDAAGTAPVTAVGQPVGLMLDKRLGLVRGAELIPAPLNLTAGPWATLGVLSATATSMTNTSGAGAGKSIASLMTAGKTYEISCSYTKSDAATILSISTDAGVVILSSTAASGTLSGIFVNATAQLYLRLGGNCTVIINNISVRELPGNHATQPTTTARPLDQLTPARLVFDGVDDAHITNFASALGSTCTVVRSIPGVGASILTSQTIGTSYTNTTTHSGLIIINRALTAGEAASATTWANQKAGV